MSRMKVCKPLENISLNFGQLLSKTAHFVGDLGVVSLLSLASTVLTKMKLQTLNISKFSTAVIGHYGKAITNLILNELQNVGQKGLWVIDG